MQSNEKRLFLSLALALLVLFAWSKLTQRLAPPPPSVPKPEALVDTSADRPPQAVAVSESPSLALAPTSAGEERRFLERRVEETRR